MNSARKIVNQQNTKDTRSTVSAAKGGQRISDDGVSDTKKIIIGVACAVVLLILCGGVAIQQFKPKVVLTVNDKKFTLEDMMYPIYERESEYLPYDETYQMYMGTSVWESSYMGSDRSIDSSVTNEVGLKQEIINAETAYEILYKEAQNAGYALEDADRQKVTEDVAKGLKGLNLTQRLKLNISDSKLTKRYEKRVLADKYRDAQRESLRPNVDEKKITKDISKKDYREYKLQYYAFSTSSQDDDGNTKKISSDKKKELSQKLKQLHKRAVDGEDFTTLLGEEESDIQYADTSFTEKTGWSFVTTPKLLKNVKSLKNSQISDIIEDTKSGYVLFVKMIDNNSTESYDKACEDAIEGALDTEYDTWYEGIFKNYTVETNSDIWDDITIGTVTTDIVTLEDLKKMNEDSSAAAAQ